MRAQAAAKSVAEVRAFDLKATPEGLQLTASLQLTLGQEVQEVLQKGVPIHFVAEADVRRQRWYWRDAAIAKVKRRSRLSYSPLSRRWLVAHSGSGRTDVNLQMSYASLDEALVAVRNIGPWQVAAAEALNADERYAVELRFDLDLSQLPRPFQIGLEAQSSWSVKAQAKRKLLWPAQRGLE